MDRRTLSPGLTWTLLGICVSCAVLAGAAIHYTRLTHGLSLVWVANAPLIAGLCLLRRERWLLAMGCAAFGMFTTVLLVSSMPFTSIGLMSANIAEAAIAAALLRRWNLASAMFLTTRSVPPFVLAVVAAPVISGLAGAAFASISVHEPLLSLWSDWMVGHSLGNLVATPLAILCIRRDGLRALFVSWRTGARAAGWTALVALTAAVVFRQTSYPLLFLPILPLLIATFALRAQGAALSVVAVGLVGAWSTLHGTGPIMLIHQSEAMRLHFFDFYLAALILIALPVAATLAQRDALLEALAESEARYRMLADNATDIILTMSLDGTIRFVSPSIMELGYFEPESLIGRNALDLVAEEDRPRVRAEHETALAHPEKTRTYEYRAVKANGEIGWFETATRAVRADDGRLSNVVSIIRDAQGRKEREDELRRAATTDPLTGLLNRAAFRSKVDAAALEAWGGMASALAVLDLDHFKRVNDVHGHAAGDAALLMLADLLRENLRPQDAVGRVGGEEFAILFAGLNIIAARAVCDRLRKRLEERPVYFDGRTFHITMSAGIAPLNALNCGDAAMRQADIALYAAKAAGRNRIEITA